MRTRAWGAVAFEDGHNHFQGSCGLAGAGDRFAAVFDAMDYVNPRVSIEGVQQLGVAGGSCRPGLGEGRHVDRFPGQGRVSRQVCGRGVVEDRAARVSHRNPTLRAPKARSRTQGAGPPAGRV